MTDRVAMTLLESGLSEILATHPVFRLWRIVPSGRLDVILGVVLTFQ
jgi:hypothetical protein